MSTSGPNLKYLKWTPELRPRTESRIPAETRPWRVSPKRHGRFSGCGECAARDSEVSNRNPGESTATWMIWVEWVEWASNGIEIIFNSSLNRELGMLVYRWYDFHYDLLRVFKWVRLRQPQMVSDVFSIQGLGVMSPGAHRSRSEESWYTWLFYGFLKLLRFCRRHFSFFSQISMVDIPIAGWFMLWKIPCINNKWMMTQPKTSPKKPLIGRLRCRHRLGWTSWEATPKKENTNSWAEKLFEAGSSLWNKGRKVGEVFRWYQYSE